MLRVLIIERKAPSLPLNACGNYKLDFTQNIEVPQCLYDAMEQVLARLPADLLFH